MQLIAAFVAKQSQKSDDWSDLAAALIETHGDRDLVFRYWTPERLFSVAARQQWQTPDRLPLEL